MELFFHTQVGDCVAGRPRSESYSSGLCSRHSCQGRKARGVGLTAWRATTPPTMDGFDVHAIYLAGGHVVPDVRVERPFPSPRTTRPEPEPDPRLTWRESDHWHQRRQLCPTRAPTGNSARLSRLSDISLCECRLQALQSPDSSPLSRVPAFAKPHADAAPVEVLPSPPQGAALSDAQRIADAELVQAASESTPLLHPRPRAKRQPSDHRALRPWPPSRRCTDCTQGGRACTVRVRSGACGHLAGDRGPRPQRARSPRRLRQTGRRAARPKEAGG